MSRSSAPACRGSAWPPSSSMAGVESFHLYEQWDDLGGTWHANTYPGLHCDVASRYYQYTFAPNPDWSQRNASGREIWAYLNEVADRFGVRERTSFRHACDRGRVGRRGLAAAHRRRSRGGVRLHRHRRRRARAHQEAGRWRGWRRSPAPVFHSAEWDHSVALEGKRIGVIGTGSTGMQITRAARAGRRPLRAVPAHAAVDLPAAQPALHARDAMALPPLPGAQPRRLPRLAADRSRRRSGGRSSSPGSRRKVISAACRLHLRSVRDPELRRRFTPATSRCASAW